MKRRLVADVSWLWAGYAGRSLAYLGVTVVLTRSLGPAGFGELSLFMALGLGVAALAGSWPFLAIPVLVHRGRTVAQVFRPAARLALLATFACLAVALPLSWKILAPDGVTVAFLAIYSVTLVGLQGLYGVFQAEGRMRGIAAVQTGERSLTLAILVAIVVVSGLTVRSAEGAIALAALSTCAIAYLTLTRRTDLLGKGAKEALDWRLVLKTIGAMGIVNAGSYGVAWVDIYLLAAFKPGSDVGIYSLSYQIYSFALQLASLWIVATLPRHARSFHAGVAPAEQLPQEEVRMGVRLWASLVGVGAVIAAVTLTVVFGESFADSAQPLMILLVGASFLAAYLAVISVLIAADKSTLIARVSIVCVSVNVAVDLILIPTVGLIGPAIATTAQAAVGAVWLLSHTLGTRRLMEIVRVNAPVAIAISILAIDPTSVPLLVITGVISAITAFPAIHWLRDRDLRAPKPTQPTPVS
ncbi:MAG TPA: oligosaccharide flippase family protein [Solirubrobacterales bacterium]|nr:oligosaccharide flippase family protein [Solirubrobacterales bacterium]